MIKLGKSQLPLAHTKLNFECFGPVATKDGEFSGTKIADLGCFDQDGKDSNKFYFGCVAKSKLNQKYYCYFEWGRTGLTPDFQFYECDSESEAQGIYEKQIHSKNDKRGIWYNHPVLGKLLKAKPGKDCYLIRQQAVRTTGLPDARKIGLKVTSKVSASYDPETESLLRDLQIGNIEYTKSNFSSGFIPTLEAINEARLILVEAAKGKDLKELTKLLYSKIPKVTHIGEKVELQTENIKSWLEDLDAFEDSYNNIESGSSISSTKYELQHINRTHQLWFNIERIITSSTRNRHSYLPQGMKVLNLWEVTNIPDWFTKRQEEVAKEYTGEKTPMIFQPEKTDLEKKSNSAILFHGSRSCNISGILSTGFRLPKALKGVQINGSLIGNGVYHADDWKKSAGYTSIDNSYWSNGSGKIINRKAFMFLNDVILGNTYNIQYPKHFDNPPEKYHSVVALEGGSFQNREYVVYNIDSFYPKYLIEFQI